MRRQWTVHPSRPRLLAALLGLLLSACGLAGCGGDPGGGGEPSEVGDTLTVLAASSLTDAFRELERIFEEQNEGVDVQTSFGGSSELLLQLQQGAPADVFASADEAKMNTALEEGLVREPEIFVRNRPVVIVPADNPAGIEAFGELGEADAQIVLPKRRCRSLATPKRC